VNALIARGVQRHPRRALWMVRFAYALFLLVFGGAVAYTSVLLWLMMADTANCSTCDKDYFFVMFMGLFALGAAAFWCFLLTKFTVVADRMIAAMGTADISVLARTRST